MNAGLFARAISSSSWRFISPPVRKFWQPVKRDSTKITPANKIRTKRKKFDKLGVFCYSREKLSKSYNFKGKKKKKTKLRRKKILLDVQKEVVREKNREKIGIVYNALVEGRDLKKKDTYIVRPYFDARDIDDKVYVKSKEPLFSGSFVNVEIKSMKGYDLEGETI